MTDDNFATIVDTVKEGRGIYANLKKVVGFFIGWRLLPPNGVESIEAGRTMLRRLS